MEHLRQNYPLLQQLVHGKRLAYLDNAATTQKPDVVIEAYQKYYCQINANVHRGSHFLSEQATSAYEATRDQLCDYLHAADRRECIFTSGATAALNLIARSFSEAFLKPGDTILITPLEHHANLVPWQQACQRHQARLVAVPLTATQELDLEQAKNLLKKKPKLFALTALSNVLGTATPYKTLIDYAHAEGVPVVLDGVQLMPHGPIDVQALDCDFIVGSAHKMYGPTGLGFLYGKRTWLEQLPPMVFGGDMIKTVSLTATTYNDLPYKFEAGTPAIAEVTAFGACLKYLSDLPWNQIEQHQERLVTTTEDQLLEQGVHVFAAGQKKSNLLSFCVPGIHAHDLTTLLDQQGVAIRGGHHCAMPLITHLKVPAVSRVSFGIYNTLEDVTQLLEAIQYARKLFQR